MAKRKVETVDELVARAAQGGDRNQVQFRTPMALELIADALIAILAELQGEEKAPVTSLERS
jgi:hypothetical protein